MFGLLIASALKILVPSGPMLYVFGTTFLTAAFMLLLQGCANWMFAAAITPAIVLLESDGSTVHQVAEERLWATLIGVAVTLIVILAIAPSSNRPFGKPSVTTV